MGKCVPYDPIKTYEADGRGENSQVDGLVELIIRSLSTLTSLCFFDRPTLTILGSLMKLNLTSPIS